MSNETIMDNNRNYWNENADLWFGTTALPEYGVKFVTEDDLHLFGNVSGKKLLDHAKALLSENGYAAKLICSPMEADIDIPKDYFDFVYSIYGIGWTTDIQVCAFLMDAKKPERKTVSFSDPAFSICSCPSRLRIPFIGNACNRSVLSVL
ncbi:class I SAM-dependent methyltransferase [Eisenbergiella tayi]|uniref:Uncharacterized protein n=1 Tax=Eisenbergiella tayi TaxID=1432052 RepID=A0A1E2ZZI4_9FIRM|nr:class I SAM-dependent methyltransferase [Eisenbergiella tayi]ODM01809.1 hypothetical protein BEI61_05801 [Eisenbergiella tayi]